MKRLSLLFILLFITLLAAYTSAQIPPDPEPCADSRKPYNIIGDGCAPHVNDLHPGDFQATPLIDGCDAQGNCQDYGPPDYNKVSLYGTYGNNEPQTAHTHYQQGIDLTAQIVPRCRDGSVPSGNYCLDGEVSYPPAIMFLFLGFSNCDIEICGGNSDAWDGKDTNPANPSGHLKGQPCSTQCRNLNYPDGGDPWNQVTHGGSDTITQKSFLYQIYQPGQYLVGPHVVVFNGALGGQTLDRWDPTQAGFFWTGECTYGPDSSNPECNYSRVQHDLQYNGYSDAQVQAVFIKSSDSFPQCDLKGHYCIANPPPPGADAYQSEIYLGNILRYLKCCTLDQNFHSNGLPRYANLKQVFITSRIYGGYANGQTINGQPSGHNCLMTEPFAYEEGIAVQRTIVAQIDRTTTDYAGNVQYPESAPWFDWGPYLWASGLNISPGSLLNWCDSSTVLDFRCPNNPGDVRYGDLTPGYEVFWGDHTHPTYKAAEKVANQLVMFIQGNLPQTQKFISDWVTPWIGR